MASPTAQAALGGLPSVSIPVFSNDVEAILFVHNTLRENTADAFEAVMMKMLAPGFFNAGSTTQLNQRGADIINEARRIAYDGSSTYGDQYCGNAKLKAKQTNMVEFLNRSRQSYTRISVGSFDGVYQVTDLNVTVRPGMGAVLDPCDD